MEKDRVYDELLNFLADPVFQIPVRTYMDENCLGKKLLLNYADFNVF